LQIYHLSCRATFSVGRAIGRSPAYVHADWPGEKSSNEHGVGVDPERGFGYFLSFILCRVYEDKF